MVYLLKQVPYCNQNGVCGILSEQVTSPAMRDNKEAFLALRSHLGVLPVLSDGSLAIEETARIIVVFVRL